MASSTVKKILFLGLASFLVTLLHSGSAAAATNLVANPSVEIPNPTNAAQPQNWATDHWGTNVANFSYPTTGHTGTRSVKVQITIGGTGDAKWYFQKVPVTPGVTYTFSDYYMADIASQVTIEYTRTGGALRYVDLGMPVASPTTWQPFQKTFTIPTGVKSLTIYHLINKVGSLTVDDYSLSTGTTPPPPPPPTAFSFSLSNGGAKSVTQGLSVVNTISATLVSGTTTAVSFSASGLPANASASFSTPSCSPTCGTNVTVQTTSSTPAGTYSIQVNGAAGATTASTTFSLIVNAVTPPPPAFSFSLSNGGDKSVNQGLSVQNTITAMLITGTTANVTFSSSGLPTGASAAFSSGNCSPTCGTSVTIQTASSTPAGSYPIQITGTAGSLVTSTIFSLTVNAVTPPPVDSNIIPNPSVENQSGTAPTSWQSNKWGTNTALFTYPVEGSGGPGTKAVQVAITVYPTLDVNVGGDAKWFFNAVPVTAGQFYVFSDKYKSDITSHLIIEFHHSDGSITYQDIGAPAASASWQTFSAGFGVPAGVTTLTIYHLINAVGTLTTDDYSLTQTTNANAFGKGMVSLSFDDGWATAYTNAAPILNAAGFKSTQYIITNAIGDTANGYMTLNQITTLRDQGHDITAHTRSHPDLTTLSAADLQSEIQGSRTDLLNLGFSPVDSLAYPMGLHNSTVEQAVQSAGFKGARTVDFGFNDKATNPFQLKGAPVERGGACDGGGSAAPTTLADVKSWIDDAALNKMWLVLVLHQIDNNAGSCYGIPPSMLQSITDYLKTSNVDVVTVSQGLNQMTTP